MIDRIDYRKRVVWHIWVIAIFDRANLQEKVTGLRHEPVGSIDLLPVKSPLAGSAVKGRQAN